MKGFTSCTRDKESDRGKNPFMWCQDRSWIILSSSQLSIEQKFGEENSKSSITAFIQWARPNDFLYHINYTTGHIKCFLSLNIAERDQLKCYFFSSIFTKSFFSFQTVLWFDLENNLIWSALFSEFGFCFILFYRLCVREIFLSCWIASTLPLVLLLLLQKIYIRFPASKMRSRY